MSQSLPTVSGSIGAIYSNVISDVCQCFLVGMFLRELWCLPCLSGRLRALLYETHDKISQTSELLGVICKFAVVLTIRMCFKRYSEQRRIGRHLSLNLVCPIYIDFNSPVNLRYAKQRLWNQQQSYSRTGLSIHPHWFLAWSEGAGGDPAYVWFTK